jgi:hypothetical protein
MIQISETPSRLKILSPMPVGRRIVFALIALIPLLAPYELLYRVQWNDYWNPFFLFAALICVGAVALSGLLLFVAVAGLSSRMVFDRMHSSFTYSEVAPLVPQRTRVFPLSSIESIQVRTHEWSDGAPSYSMTVRMEHGATFETSSLWSREEIEQVKDQTETFLAIRASTPSRHR